MANAQRMQRLFWLQQSHHFEQVFPNVYLDGDNNEMDLCCVRKSGYIEEIEVKISKSDFQADFKKIAYLKLTENELLTMPRLWNSMGKVNKHEAIAQGRVLCNRFSFLMPRDLVEKCDIPDYAGIWVYDPDTKREWVSQLRTATLLHKRKVSPDVINKAARNMTNRYWRSIIGQRELL